MGKINVAIQVHNWEDLSAIALGTRTAPARCARAEALVDTGATGLYLRSSLIQALGLRPTGERASRTMSNRWERRRVFSPVELDIQGRSCLLAVVEVPDELPNLIGQVPLELLDWVIDPAGRKLIGNPDHGGQHMFEELCHAQESAR